MTDEPTQAAIPKLPLEKLSAGGSSSGIGLAAAEQDAAPVREEEKRRPPVYSPGTPDVPVVPQWDANPAPDLPRPDTPDAPLLWNHDGRLGTSSTMDGALRELHSDLLRGASPPPSAPPPVPIFGRTGQRQSTGDSGSQGIWPPNSPPSTSPLYIADLHPRRPLPPLDHPSKYQEWDTQIPAKQNSTTWIGGPWNSAPILPTHGGHRPVEDPPPAPPLRPPSAQGPSAKGDREMMHAVLSGKLYKSSLALGMEGAKMRQWGERRVMEMARKNPKEVLAAIRMHSQRVE